MAEIIHTVEKPYGKAVYEKDGEGVVSRRVVGRDDEAELSASDTTIKDGKTAPIKPAPKAPTTEA